MKRIIITIFTIWISFTIGTNAQDRVWANQLCFDLGYASPSGLHSDILDLDPGFGITADYYYQLEQTPNLFISGSVAYQSMKSIFGTLSSTFAAAGVRYNFALEGFQPYAGGEFGLTFIGTPDKYPAKLSSTFGIALKGGFRYPISPGMDFDANLKYLKFMGTTTKLTIFGFNAGVAFPI